MTNQPKHEEAGSEGGSDTEAGKPQSHARQEPVAQSGLEKKLRTQQNDYCDCGKEAFPQYSQHAANCLGNAFKEAADEISRLRAELAAWKASEIYCREQILALRAALASSIEATTPVSHGNEKNCVDLSGTNQQEPRSSTEALRAFAESVLIYRIEGDEDYVRLSFGGEEIAARLYATPAGIALLKMEASRVAATKAVEERGDGSATGRPTQFSIEAVKPPEPAVERSGWQSVPKEEMLDATREVLKGVRAMLSAAPSVPGDGRGQHHPDTQAALPCAADDVAQERPEQERGERK